jgi:hypothetical protein
MKNIYLLLIFLLSVCKCYPQMYVADSTSIRINMLSDSTCEYMYSMGCLVHVKYLCRITRDKDSTIVLTDKTAYGDSLFVDRWIWKDKTLTPQRRYHFTLRPQRPRCDTSEVYEIVDVMPEYPGGQGELGKFIMMNFRYKSPDDDSDIQMTFLMEFIIDRTGKVTNLKILNRLTDSGKEMLRVISSMPAWKPGSCEGTNVAVRMSMPIRF